MDLEDSKPLNRILAPCLGLAEEALPPLLHLVEEIRSEVYVRLYQLEGDSLRREVERGPLALERPRGGVPRSIA